VNKSRFLEILSNPLGMSDFDVQELESLAESMPYSQPVHIALAMKKHRDADDDQAASKAIQEASLFVFDRRRFKSILQDGLPGVPVFTTAVPENYEDETGTLTGNNDENPAHIDTGSEIGADSEEGDYQAIHLEEIGEDEAIASMPEEESKVHSEIEEPLRNLRMSREMATREDEGSDNTEETNTEAERNVSTVTEVPGPIINGDTDDHPTENNLTATLGDSDTPSYSYGRAKNRRKEQMELIDRFIEKSPSIPKGDALRISDGEYEGKDLSTAGEDLADNHLVSENLANILVRQGKIDRAINIYEKLILKFPQKKSYFASRIEELKSNG
jgi:hypothetical protein